MLNSFKELFNLLLQENINFCHWKSNDRLKDALEGKEDLDLLVNSAQLNIFKSILTQQGFKKAIKLEIEQTPCIQHFYSLDRETGILLHIHVYYRIITGGSILKNYHLRAEEKFLKNCEINQGILVPKKSTDLIFFCIRKFLEYGSFVESIMTYREKKIIRGEISYLSKDINIKEITKEAIDYFPHLDADFFELCLNEFIHPTTVINRFRLGRALQRKFKNFSIDSFFLVEFLRILRISRIILKKIFNFPRSTTIEGGGAIIAIIGADATGKSSLVREITNWLKSELWCERAHTGLPPVTTFSFLPRFIFPLLKKIIPSYRTTVLLRHVQKNKTELKGLRLIVFSLRSLMIAYDRLKLCSSIFSKSRKGAFIICDRYPCQIPGAMDSAQLDPLSSTVKKSFFARKMSQLEGHIYSCIPLPDIIIRLTVPLNIALKRNNERFKKGKDTDTYIKERHELSKKSVYKDKKIFEIDTNKTMDETIKEIKEIIWVNL